jgi:hypothetical protein
MVVLFGLIGMMRGWAKELLVSFSMVLALAFSRLLESYVPFIKDLPVTELPMFWLRLAIIVTLVFFGYQTTGLPHFTGKLRREKLQDSLLGFILGAVNGFLIFGSIWAFMDQAKYPFIYITAPDGKTEMGKAALNLLPALAPHLLGEPAIYFAALLCFIFVLVVFI